MNKLLSILVLVALTISCVQRAAEGRFDFISLFESQLVENRNIQIYLPPSYDQTSAKYPVLYMHDGQMLFDSTTTWNGQEWGVDEVMDRLIAKGTIGEAIIVGIWNGGDDLRHAEYFPQKPFESLSQNIRDSLYQLERNESNKMFGSVVQSDNYLKFLITELKPFIDKNYRTLNDQENTFIAGSSMGGLISWYGICEYPDIFGGAICMSTHWPGVFTTTNNPIPEAFFSYMRNNLPNPATHKFYFDYGTETLDKLYVQFQPIVDSIFLQKGFDQSTFLAKKFNGHAHDERSWNSRLHIPLTFLLKKN